MIFRPTYECLLTILFILFDLDDEAYKFTNNPDELIGQRHTTHLVKGKQGFGFTIIGGDDPDEFLQIRNILPKGPAHQDGVLQTGKGLVDG